MYKINKKFNILFLGCIIFGFILFSFEYNIYKINNNYLVDPSYACHDTLSCKSKSSISKKEYAFVSVIHNNDYLDAALVLGYTINKYHKNITMYLMHYDNIDISYNSICKLKNVGWELYPVNDIKSPSEKIKKQFQKNFIKLHLWNMTLFESIIYLDADTIILGKIDEIFRVVDKRIYNNKLGFEFAATPDNYGLPNDDFNAGVFVLRPNIGVYNEMLKLYNNTDKYDIKWAEQSFLNEYFRFRYLRLPEIYNFNVAFWKRKPDLWEKLFTDMKIIHYTIIKPFLPESIIESITFRRYRYRYILKPWYDIYNEMQDYLKIKL